MLVAEEHCLALLLVIRILEQPESELDPQDAPHRLVDQLDGERTLLDQRLDVLCVAGTDHLHVNAGHAPLECCILLVGGEAVGNHLDDRIPVADHEAVEAPLPFQNLSQGKRIARSWHAVQIVEGAHQRGHTCLDAGMEGDQVHVP